nr:uncharacterized protein LOC124497918 [Dermatophagoides farinae]
MMMMMMIMTILFDCLFIISIWITNVFSIHSMAVNINVISPQQPSGLNRTAFVGNTTKSMVFNVKLPDQFIYDNDDDYGGTSLQSLSIGNRLPSLSTTTVATTIDEQNDDDNVNPDKFIKSILQGPSKEFVNDSHNKKTDVSVTIFHHQAIHDKNKNDNQTNKSINLYGNGYGLHYGYDLDGQYSREKGYKFEKALGREICKDKKSCKSTSERRYDDDETLADYTPDTALKEHIRQIIRHGNDIDLNGLLLKKKQRKKILIYDDDNNNKKNSQNYFNGPFTKLDSLHINSSPTQTMVMKKSKFQPQHVSFYYPEMIETNRTSPIINHKNYGLILDSMNENRPYKSSDIITLFKWTNPTLSNVYYPHKILHLSDDDYQGKVVVVI